MGPNRVHYSEFHSKQKANHQNYIEHLVSYLAFLTSMKAVFQIVFEMTSFFILIFADHVIVIIHPYTVYHSQYLYRTSWFP